MSDDRRAHAGRVADLLGEWASVLALPERDGARWRAAGWLHDALRDAPAGELRGWLEPPFSELAASLLHGPAAAARLEAEGVADADLLDAIRYHTLGHPRLGRLGRALYLADFLEPGRDFAREWRAELRRRMPDALPEVLREVVSARLRHLLEEGHRIRPETLGLWNELAERP